LIIPYPDIVLVLEYVVLSRFSYLFERSNISSFIGYMVPNPGDDNFFSVTVQRKNVE
jgi:hypothetical protein